MGVKLSLKKYEGHTHPETLETYQNIVGALLYLLANCTRPYIAKPLGNLACFMSTQSDEHLEAAKQVLRYLACTPDYGIMYKQSGNAMSGVAGTKRRTQFGESKDRWAKPSQHDG